MLHQCFLFAFFCRANVNLFFIIFITFYHATIYIYIDREIVDFGKSDKMRKISGKEDKPDTDNAYIYIYILIYRYIYIYIYIYIYSTWQLLFKRKYSLCLQLYLDSLSLLFCALLYFFHISITRVTYSRYFYWTIPSGNRSYRSTF